VFICPTTDARTVHDFVLADYRYVVAILETLRFETRTHDTFRSLDLACVKHPSPQEVSRLRSIALKTVGTLGGPKVQD
jgi:hypothetical protein